MNENLSRNKKVGVFNSISQAKITQDIPYKNILFASFVVNVLTICLVLLFRKSHLPPVVPLYYGLPEGDGQIAPSIYLTIPSIIALGIILINSLITSLLKDDFLKKTLIIASLGTTFFSVITIIKIIFLVGSF